MNTLFRDNRIERLLADLKDLILPRTLVLSQISFMKGRFDTPQAAQSRQSSLLPWTSQMQWGGRNDYFWFCSEADLPEIFLESPLVLRVSTAFNQQSDTALLSSFVAAQSHSWDLMNPQFMLFVNHQLRQGMDINHDSAALFPEDYASGHITLEFQAYTGLTDSRYNFLAEICCVDLKVKDLYFDILTLYEAALSLPKDNPDRLDLLDIINAALNLLDLRNPGSSDFYSSIKNAAKLLRTKGFGKPDTSIEITCIGHSHIDMAWLWDIEQTRLKAQRTFSTVLSMQKLYPDYIFMHTSPQLYAYIKKDNPELYRQIKEQIRRRKWEPEGAMWLEADCNIPCGESLVRQILYGKQFMKKEFHVESTVLWLPDVFGYSAALPQILKKSGIDCFVTSKISWNMLNTMPYDTFMWKGIDGEEILTYFMSTPELGSSEGNCGATYNGVLHPETVYGTWKNYKQKEINRHVLMCYGYGDGGGGPSYEMLEKLSRLKKGVSGFPTVTSSHVHTYFSSLKEQMKNCRYLPVWTGELYLELHQGTYTSNGEIKQNNRKSEIQLMAMESLFSFLSAFSIPYPGKKFRNLWKLLLLNQFHDILPGSSIKKVYEDSRMQFSQLFKELEYLESEGLKRLASNITSDREGMLLYNPSSFARKEIVKLPGKSGGVPVSYRDQSGYPLLSQPLDPDNILVEIPEIPPMGYTVCTIYPIPSDIAGSSDLFVSENHMENDFFSFDFNNRGNIINLFDKKNQRMIFKDDLPGNLLRVYEDRPYRWDSWNLDMYYREKSWKVEEIVQWKIVEQGPVRAGLNITYNYNCSQISQTIYLYRAIPRIDFFTEIDWQENSSVLKAEFPFDINTDFATYEIQYGSIRRPTHTNTSWDMAKYEVCAHKWADISEGEYGISILNDSKYGYSAQGSTMSLTLLKAGIAPDPTIDRGKHTFTYSLYPHKGGTLEGGTVRAANLLNIPVLTYPMHVNKGTLTPTASFISCSASNIIIDCLKEAEDHTSLILRFYESGNKHCRPVFCSQFFIESAAVCDLMENFLYELTLSNPHTFSLKVKPFEIVTCKLHLKKIETVHNVS